MAFLPKFAGYDNDLIVQASAAKTASAAMTILDRGAAQEGWYALIVDVTAITINDNDEEYHFEVQLSSSATFASTIHSVAEMVLGANEVLSGDVDSVIGRYILPFSTHYAATNWRYIRPYVTIAGTTPSVTFSAFVVPLEHL